MAHPCKCECHPFQAKDGFIVGSESCCKNGLVSDALAVYGPWTAFQPIVNGLVNNIGSQYKQIGDQVYVNLNILFVAESNSAAFVLSNLPLPIKTDTYPSNGAALQAGFTAPPTLTAASISTVFSDVTTMTVTNSSPLVTGDPYVLNAQITYST